MNPSFLPLTPIFCAAFLFGGMAGAQTPEPAKAPVPAMEELSPGVFRIGLLKLDKNRHTVTLPATLNMEEGNLEYVLVSKKGSTHESLLATEVEPSQLHFAMLLLGAKGAGISTPGPKDAPPPQINAEYLKRAPDLKGDALLITATWTDKAGQKKTVPVEDWLEDIESKKAASRGPWIYTGSMFYEDKFLAELEGCFVALVTNPSALINNPRKGKENDQIWGPRTKAVPPRDTPVEVTFKLEPAAP